MCDSFFDTFFNIKDKAKNDLNFHQNLVDMGIREQLHPRSIGKGTYLPPNMSYIVIKRENKFL